MAKISASTLCLKTLLAANLLWPCGARADTITDLKAFLASNTSMQGQFQQTVLPTLSGAKATLSSGNFTIQRPGRFRWAYTSPDEQLIVANDKQVWLYDADLKQATLKQIGTTLDASPAALLAGDQIDKLYELRNLTTKDGVAWLQAIPRNESTFKRVEIGLRNGKLAEMLLFDQFGQTTRIVINQLVLNGAIDAALFRFTPPKNVDVVRE